MTTKLGLSRLVKRLRRFGFGGSAQAKVAPRYNPVLAKWDAHYDQYCPNRTGQVLPSYMRHAD
jgi:hypothetical protein